MTHHMKHAAKAMTAIAAVLAFSSTQSFAQDSVAPPEPVADSSAETPTEAPTADTLAPEPAAETAATPPPAPKPKVETSKTQASATRTERTKASASSSATRSTVRQARATAPAAAVAAPAAAPVAAPAAAVELPAPLPAEPTPPVTAEPVAPAVAEPPPASGMPGSLMADLMTDDRLPATGAAALGLLALGGAGIALRRRKRRRENEELEARQQFLDMAQAEPPVLELEPAAEVRPGPAFARAPAPIHDPVPDRNAPVTSLPDGFDLSRFGPHVQAAYRGPTADNPSLSLKYRLRRAGAMDKQEARLAQQAGSRPKAAAPANIPAKGNWESRSDADFLFRRADKQEKQPAGQN